MASILSDSTNSDDQQQISELISQAYALLCDERISESIQLYKKCIEQNPKCWRAYQNIGVAYIMVKDYQNANKMLRIYARNMPRDPLGHDSLGVSYSELNDPLQAIASFVNAINLSPTYYMPYYNLGVTLGRLELNQFALNVYKHCLNLYPTYVNAMNNIGDILKKAGKIDQAIEVFKQVIETDPDYALGFKNLGNCYFSKKEYYPAFMAYFQGLQIDPKNESVRNNLALCLDHFQLYKQAATEVFLSYYFAHNKDLDQNVVKPFIAGNLWLKTLHYQYGLSRLLTKHKISFVEKQLLQIYEKIMEAFNFAAKLLPTCEEIYQNINITKQNLIGYLFKLNMVPDSVINSLNNTSLAVKIKKHMQKQQIIVKQIRNWHIYTKSLVRKHPPLTKRPTQYYEQQKNIAQIVQDKTTRYKYILRCYKTSTYISRTYNHNFRRLILKRTKFIKKYNQFNKVMDKIFKYKRPLITLTDNRQQMLQAIQEVLQSDKNIEVQGQIIPNLED